MNLEELQSFCPQLGDICFYKAIATPWSFREWTYATDGRIMIRVPVMPSVRVQKNIKLRITALNLFRNHYSTWAPYVPLSLPVRPKADRLKQLVTSLGHRIVDWRYLERISALPRLRIAVKIGRPFDPVAFRFVGGTGLLMPMQPCEEEKKAA